MMNHQSQALCPRCGMARLCDWRELSDEEQEVVQRLPASADYSLAERRAAHRWCPNCWYEETESLPRDA